MGGVGGLRAKDTCGGVRARLGRGGGVLGAAADCVLAGTTTRGMPKEDTSWGGRLAEAVAVRGER